MSEACIESDRFWREFKSDVAGTLSAEQRSEIERVLDMTGEPARKDLGDLRLSFKWFFVRLMWGPEKRNADRIKQEQELHPPVSRKNIPGLASMLAGYAAVVYIALSLGLLAIAYVSL